ncbi:MULTISPECIES: KAP family P-loop NTPase fold protein [Bradyrhizobium]|jgi:predicted KAP-like P-loop ATPase|uniref:Putative KAP-like P-loop ATPase n=1 Tax=Bradyrhizobium elkanii TaxID=29448 RepID=A0A8I2BX64_BRAEL|nr:MULTISPECIES: P-loop NTPase fold protein [Bradyrhizobium]MBP1290630.1 putative KAP-like P-loop ATPase [Bradyrhizobium elkanii]MCP1972394.1 putative KAP-like P-loop ATPase [Bradyrhizobium elkanii]MCS3452656.1 putative KAP-like P-loop ATPase [Bradyrhizobium elkanii]MCS3473625.1 putative KAP-like P-loop ATPase [Bradyrhizobium elkanii]MCS3565240.1 putative KAP-like P-loop ATPase [Bradyrhizobium elkanii]
MSEFNPSPNDAPIKQPAEDRFGIDPFAQALASSIRKIKAPEGTVIALNGPWGSGKSSAVNLILHHLKDAVAADEIAIVNFACWWFRGEEALALAFFRELYAGLGPSLGDRFKKALPKIGAQLLRTGALVGAAADLAGYKGAGKAAEAGLAWLADLIHTEDTVEKLHAELTAALGAQKKRFLIVIDDIDRLSPDEALLIFRLVKSVGRLPNVIYLLVFDRELAEGIVSERFPSEGPHYLEKIIQAGFDLPLPQAADLNQELLRQIGTLCGSPPEEQLKRFMNVFYEVIAPEIRTPRDLIRLMNALAVTWAAVGSEVDLADFVALETLRLLRGEVYRVIRANKGELCGLAPRGTGDGRGRASEIDSLLLGSVKEIDRPRLRRVLMRLFPRLESVWNNLHYGEGSDSEWVRERRVCTKEHFGSYFRFSVGDDVLPREEIKSIIARASDAAFVQATLRAALSVARKDGTTKAQLLLDEMTIHAGDVADKDVGPLLTAVFELGDEVDVPGDRAKAFSVADNVLRIHWLLRRLTLERFDLATRSAIFVEACSKAGLAWLADFSSSAYRDYYPVNGRAPEPESNCLTTEADAVALEALTLNRIRAASQSGELLKARRLARLLFDWRDLAKDDGAEVKAWTAEQFKNDAAIVTFARAFTTYSWSQGMGMSGLGDIVAKRHTRAGVDSLDKVLDLAAFRSRVEELDARNATDDDGAAIHEFLEAWRRRDKNPRD